LSVLLAQFHPYADDRVVLTVARVVCEGETARIEPVAIDGQATTTGMLAKLRYLVERSAPRPFENLARLRSRFWSFVMVEAPVAPAEE
jgi:hypothetical protein